LISVLTPTVMVAMMIRPTIIAPWILSVRKEILKPPSAMGHVSAATGPDFLDCH
jgi:hypothetical protein